MRNNVHNISETKREAKSACVSYIKYSLKEFFDCGDSAYARECYDALSEDDENMYEEVIDYLYDHDDDNTIDNCAAECDVDFPEDMIKYYIKKFYKAAYNEFINGEQHSINESYNSNIADIKSHIEEHKKLIEYHKEEIARLKELMGLAKLKPAERSKCNIDNMPFNYNGTLIKFAEDKRADYYKEIADKCDLQTGLYILCDILDGLKEQGVDNPFCTATVKCIYDLLAGYYTGILLFTEDSDDRYAFNLTNSAWNMHIKKSTMDQYYLSLDVTHSDIAYTFEDAVNIIIAYVDEHTN